MNICVAYKLGVLLIVIPMDRFAGEADFISNAMKSFPELMERNAQLMRSRQAETMQLARAHRAADVAAAGRSDWSQFL